MSQWKELPTQEVEFRGHRFRVQVVVNFPAPPFEEPAADVEPDVVQITDIELLDDSATFSKPSPEAIAASLGIPVSEFIDALTKTVYANEGH